MWENLLASWRQSGQKQDPCPSLLNHNAKYKRLLPPYCDFANGVRTIAGTTSFAEWRSTNQGVSREVKHAQDLGPHELDQCPKSAVVLRRTGPAVRAHRRRHGFRRC